MSGLVGTNENPQEQGKWRERRDTKESKYTNIHTKVEREISFREEGLQKRHFVLLVPLGGFISHKLITCGKSPPGPVVQPLQESG